MRKMTSKERILRAVEHQEPDRVPICPRSVDYTWLTPLVGHPAGWKDLVSFSQQVGLAHERGAKFHLMATGRLMDNLETIRDIGVDILSPFAPPPNGDADLRRAKALIGDKVCVWGGISAPLLQKAKPPEVEEMVQKAVEEAAEGGGFVLSTADSLNPNTPLENIRAFVETGKRYGRYR